VDRLDLVQLNWWDYAVDQYVAVGEHFVELQREGLVVHVGTTHMGTGRLVQMRERGISVVVNQAQVGKYYRMRRNAGNALVMEK
jgi:aryl-alcohol dehydrogenase-like predicted oxidoreductase